MVGARLVPLTGEGELVGTDVDGRFQGVTGLVDKLLASRRVTDCVHGQLLKYLLGRDTARPANRLAVDQQAIASIAAADLKEALVQLVASPAFLFRDASKLPAQGARP
jgi:hypothetical protein